MNGLRRNEDAHVAISSKTFNSPLGIILCAEKDQALAKYSVLDENKQIFASKYKLVLPSPEELKAEVEREIHLLKKRAIEN
jgi:diphthamide biosynthesis methyltransferase